MGVIMYNGIQYTGAGGGGSDVTPNPEGSATDILKKLEIEDTIYGISNTIELTQAEYDNLPSSKLTDNILYIIKDAAGASGGNNKTLSGTVAPTAALGDNGDEYIQYHLSSNTPVIDKKYTKIRGNWVQYQDDSTVVVPVAPAYSAGAHIDINQSNEISATYSAFQGTDGTDPGSSGLVPAPVAADVDKVLGANGQWVTPTLPEVNHTYYGTDVPSSNLGNNGDTYYKYNIDTSHYDDTLLNVNIPAESSDSWVLTEGVLNGVSTIYGVGSWFYGALSKVINVADIPDYPTTPRENFLYGNNNSNSSIAKSGNDLYLYVHGGITITGIYSRVYEPIPTNIAAIYIKVDGIWITTT